MKKKLLFANKKRLLLLFVPLLGPFLFEVHPPGNFSGYGPENKSWSLLFLLLDDCTIFCFLLFSFPGA